MFYGYYAWKLPLYGYYTRNLRLLSVWSEAFSLLFVPVPTFVERNIFDLRPPLRRKMLRARTSKLLNFSLKKEPFWNNFTYSISLSLSKPNSLPRTGYFFQELYNRNDRCEEASHVTEFGIRLLINRRSFPHSQNRHWHSLSRKSKSRIGYFTILCDNFSTSCNATNLKSDQPFRTVK